MSGRGRPDKYLRSSAMGVFGSWFHSCTQCAEPIIQFNTDVQAEQFGPLSSTGWVQRNWGGRLLRCHKCAAEEWARR